MLSQEIIIGFTGEKVQQALDDSMVCVKGIIPTNKFYFVDSSVCFRNKKTNERLIGIYEEHREDGTKYVWCRLYNSLLKTLVSEELLERA